MAVYIAGAASASGAEDYGKRAARIALKAAGPLASLGAVALLVAWGNGVWLGPAGGIPEISAHDTIFKRLPADHGGIRSPFEGRAINRLIGGNSATIADREAIRLAPPPAQLHVLDLSPRELAAERNADAASRYGFMGRPAGAAPVSERVPISGPGQASETAPEPATELASEDVQKQEPLKPVMYAPMRRDPELARVDPAPEQPQSFGNEVDAAAVPSGTHVAQLGDYTTRDAARRAWRMLHSTFTNLLGDRDWLIQETASGGRPLFRLRVLGFNDRPDASTFCARLNARQTQCIPTTMR